MLFRSEAARAALAETAAAGVDYVVIARAGSLTRPYPELVRDMREALAALPLKRYEGEVVMVHSRAALERAVEDLHAERVVGWDTETRPAFRPGESYLPSVVQMATASAVYLFQPRRFDVAHELSGFFAAAAMLKVGISVADDLKKLGRLFEGRFPEAPAGVLDAGHVAKRHGMAQTEIGRAHV